MATRTLTPEKSAKLARALAGAFDSLIALDRVRAEVYRADLELERREELELERREELELERRADVS